MTNNLMKLPTKILVRKFHIDFSYATRRNNKKMRVAEISAASREDAEFWFYKWIENHNEKYERKAYDNAKILSCVEIDREIIEI